MKKFFLSLLLVSLHTGQFAWSQGQQLTRQYINPAGQQIIAGANANSSFLLRDGNLFACGDNSYGQLGAGLSLYTSALQAVTAPVAFTQVATGSFHTLALDQQGQLWSWGDNQYGQCASISPSEPARPYLVFQSGRFLKWNSITCGDCQSFAIRADHTLWAWGLDNYGQLGIGSVTSMETTPVQVGADSDWVAVSAGAFHTLALKKDGSLWSWGAGSNGELGHGSLQASAMPQRIGIHKDWVMIAAAGFHSFAIKKDGSLWAWGDNEYGVLGTGDTLQRTLPVCIGEKGWQKIATGFNHTLAIRTDGSLWSWGNNFSGEGGTGNSGGFYSTPVQVANPAGWKQVAAGAAHSIAVDRKGNVFTWGNNEYGQLARGPLARPETPAPVKEPVD